MKIYPQSISGKYRGIKDYTSYLLLLIYFGVSWIRWTRGSHQPDQALLLDLPNQKAYLFSIEIWPEELYYICGLLIIAALGLFFVTSLFGRIWCGYSCPHTIFVDLFIKVESYFQGDRSARIKLDLMPWDKNKLMRKLLTYIVWFFISFSFAFGWVCYFYGAPQLATDIYNFKVTAGGLSWLAGLTASTFLFAGFIREKICTYACPYGRFQSAMLDNDTTVVSYHDWRGEPRGKDKNSGDCIDCGKCVVVCPMGIDIRDGLQMQCIGCGLCIDACDTVMDKIGKPKSLIAYDSINSTHAKKVNKTSLRKFIHFKTILFAVISLVITSIMLYKLSHKATVNFTVLRDRGALFTVLPSGEIRNKFEIKAFNKLPKNVEMTLTVEGLENAKMKAQGSEEYSESFDFTLEAENEKEFEFFVKSPINNKSAGNKQLKFLLSNKDSGEIITHDNIFIYGEN